VLNGGETTGLAARVSAAFVAAGYRAGKVGNTSARQTTAVWYGSGGESSASRIARLFGVAAVASRSVAAGHVEILLGASATVPAVPALAKPQAPAAALPPSTGAQGGAVSAKDGIPCVN
jgi:LytR cell envelope-related transcriptional attenuator